MLLLSGCADVSHVKNCLPANEHTYGFWGGTWHGMIMSFSFIGSLFSDDIAIYAVNNNGAWYNFGFIGGFFVLLKLIGFTFKIVTK
jgi:hypothetical protein